MNWLISCGIILLSISAHSTGKANRRPFQRALVMSGENINTPLFLGMLDGLSEQGHPVDLIVASCGGAIAAELIYVIPNKQERLSFVRSRSFHETLLSLKFIDHSTFDLAKVIVQHRLDQLKNSFFGYRVFPDIFNFNLIVRPTNFSQGFPNVNVPFDDRKPALVVLASRLNFDEKDVGKQIPSEQKLYSETIFTDPKTAKNLRNFPSYVGSTIPESFVENEIKVVTDASLNDAVNASFSDPVFLLPYTIKGQKYITGAVNIDPVNIGVALAKETVARYSRPYEALTEVPILYSVFGFDAQTFKRRVLARADVDYYVDFTDRKLEDLTPWLRWKVPWKGPLVQFVNNVPADYQTYLNIVQSQYEFGKARAIEALSQPRFSKAHIRKPYHSN